MLAQMAADFHKKPWLWVSGSRKQVRTFVGTRLEDHSTGGPLGGRGVCFNLPGFPQQLGAVPRASWGDDPCTSAMRHLWDGTGSAGDFAVPDLNG